MEASARDCSVGISGASGIAAFSDGSSYGPAGCADISGSSIGAVFAGGASASAVLSTGLSATADISVSIAADADGTSDLIDGSAGGGTPAARTSVRAASDAAVRASSDRSDSASARGAKRAPSAGTPGSDFASSHSAALSSRLRPHALLASYGSGARAGRASGSPYITSGTTSLPDSTYERAPCASSVRSWSKYRSARPKRCARRSRPRGRPSPRSPHGRQRGGAAPGCGRAKLDPRSRSPLSAAPSGRGPWYSLSIARPPCSVVWYGASDEPLTKHRPLGRVLTASAASGRAKTVSLLFNRTSCCPTGPGTCKMAMKRISKVCVRSALR